ncbi:DUF5130 family protein [Saccharopolyspora phatthalungensis]|uniref:Putative membrane protein YgcG n=1 Tax=Saccharopolyspora phatthalungensis TaxID=664693 RepID=A0A840Q2W1_9PSEU|nr:DUF5130 family protein [Saccharopolyspora phatthalungensis]MBB5153088.1 putative membrane protein YgcG [Saccharopolyspora phatthalungensis]
MATGEIAGRPAADPGELAIGEAMMATGRLSVARHVEPDRPRLPFSPGQLARLDEALTLSTRSTGLEFAIYLGDLGEDTRKQAEDLHAGLGPKAPEGVLIAVSPGQRKFEIVTGEEAHRRIPDRSCQLAAMSMVASFKEGELIDGIIGALRMLADAAGTSYPESRAHH